MMRLEEAKTLGELRDAVARLLTTWGEDTAIGTARSYTDRAYFESDIALHECHYLETSGQIVEPGSQEYDILTNDGEELVPAFKIT